MISTLKLFEPKEQDFSDVRSREIYSQLYYLQINCVKFLFDTVKDNPTHLKELINSFRLFIDVSSELYYDRVIDDLYLFQCCGRILNLIKDKLNANERTKLSRLIIVGLLSLRLISCLPQNTSLVSDLLSNVSSGGLGNLRINFTDLHDAFIKQPYLTNTLINVVNPIAPMKQLYTSCLSRAIELYENNHDLCWKFLHLIEQCSSFNDFSLDSVKSILSFTRDKKCLRKHVITTIGICQSSEQQYQFSLSFRDQIMTEIIRSNGRVPDQIVDIYEQLTYCLFVNGLPSVSDDLDNVCQIGWLILMTNSRTIVSLLLNVIKILIDARLVEQLNRLLESPRMSDFNQLLLVNLWHPNLADEKTMQALLDLCYGSKQPDGISNYIEQLCLKIKSRWDTLKRFNERLSTMRKEHETPTQLIMDLTTMGNTSHLELVTGLLDPTGRDSNVVLDLLDRTGAIQNNSSLIPENGNIPLETETLEENCDKNIFYCSVSIRNLWECLILFTAIETRQMVFKSLHQRNLMTDIEVIPADMSFYVRLQNALQNNDLNGCHELYQQSIVKRLEYLTSHIKKINPLSLRLELLENLYSMLFLTENDLLNTMLINNYHSVSYRPSWPLPETITITETINEDKDEEICPDLDKSKFVCSLFLLMDVVGIIDTYLKDLMFSLDDIVDDIIDTKMAKTLGYALRDEIKGRCHDLNATICDLKWRISLLTVNTSDTSYTSVGIVDFPICISFDSGSRNLSDMNKMKPNKKTRSKSTVNNRRVQKRLSKERLSSYGEERENSHPEISTKILQLGIVQSANSLINNLSNHQMKDRFMLFPSPSSTDIREPLSEIALNIDDVDLSNDFSRSSKMSKGNSLFLMNCLPLLMESIDQLTLVTLNCGYRKKAQEIYEKYGSTKCDNSAFDDMLAEIKYRDHFDDLTSQLSGFSESVDSTVSVKVSGSNEILPFGQFNWSKISALKEKLSSGTGNVVDEIFNQLISLNGRSRPTLKLDQQRDKITKDQIISDLKQFNFGLVFDIALSGSVTRWQLSQSMLSIESHYGSLDSPTQFDNGSNKPVDPSKYHRIQNLKSVLRNLLKAVTSDVKPNINNYVDLEMASVVDVQYWLLMDKWLSELQTSIQCLEFNDSETVEKSRWSCLNDLIAFIKATSLGVNKNDLPFRYLERSMPLYLDSLYSHLKIFVSFLDKYKKAPEKSKTLSSITKLQHEFSVLRRSPLNALGELIFLKSEDPYSNEMLQISDDLGLNISAVVLENCIPAIDSCGYVTVSTENDDTVVSERPQIYNQSLESVSDVVFNLDPLEIVCCCLNKIKKILLKNSYNINQTDSNIDCDDQEQTFIVNSQSANVTSGVFSISSRASTDNSSSESGTQIKDSATKPLQPTKSITESSNVLLSSGCRVFLSLSQDEDWKDLLVSDIVDLEFINLDLLRTNNDKVAFFINLYNLMMVHMLVLAVGTGKTSLKFRSLESKLMRSNFCYKIGQLGIISIEQISQYFLNIPDVTFTDAKLNSTEPNGSPPTVTEQLYRSTCVTCQNMSIFGMIDGTVSGQPLKVYNPDSIHKDLQNNLSYTIKYKTTYETEKRQIFLPQIFKWYSKLVCTENSEQRHRIGSETSRTSSSTNFDEVLIMKILSKCNEKVARKFSVLLRLDTEYMSHNIKEQSSGKLLKIIWQSRSESIGCSFIEKRQEVTSNISKLTEYTSSHNSSLNSQTAVIYQSNFPLANYQPTMEAISHLRDRSPLLACLSYLIIGDDFVSFSVTNVDDVTSPDHQIIKHRSMSSTPVEEQLSEIRTYKYSRVANEYPAIGNWIMTFWSEWLISRKSDVSSSISVFSSADNLVLFCCSSIPIEIRWATFTHPLTRNFDQIIIDYSLNIMTRDPHGYLNIGAALRMLQTQTMADSYKLQRLLDMIMEKSALYWANGLIIHTNNRRHAPPDNSTAENDWLRLQENRLLDCIYAIQDDKLRLSESTRYLDLLNIDNALKLMEYNYNITPNNASEDLKRQIVVMRIFKRIHDLVINCQNKFEFWGRAHIPTEFLDWHRLHTLSETDPDLVLKFLIKQRQFDLAKCWSRFYIPEDGEQKIEAEYLVSLVTNGNDSDKVVELISHISKLYREQKIDKFMRVVHHVISHNSAPFAIILICAYTIKNNLFNEFESVDGVSMCDWRDRVHRSWVGASMLRSISNEVIREQYSQLVEHPHLIMEQLIMNAEMEVFRKMMDLYKEQKKAYMSIKRTQIGNTLYRVPSSEFGSYDGFISELESERINDLLTEYICKALELSAIRGDEEADVDDASLSSRVMDSRMSFTSMRPDLTASSDSGGTVVNAESKIFSTSDTASVAETYYMPTIPPPPEKWYKDSDATKCMCCTKEKFSMFNRRHHCRRCGRVICAQCSTHRMLIAGVTVRICDDCNRAIINQQDSDNRARRGSVFLDNNRIGSVAELLYNRHKITTRSESLTSLPNVGNFDLSEMSPVTVLQLGVGALENGWRLGTDPIENETIRQMFYYDDAPSVTIAFSLADFHSNSNACGNVLLNRVEYLADFLKPMRNHLPNPEVDYLLVLDMAKQIAYKAKLKFSRLNNDLDFDRAENYLSRLDLLSVLVKSSFCNYLPSLSEGSKFIDRIQSLRDKLIREERLELAGIVSNKAGLPNDPVFVVMGLHALDEGRYEDARKLFASCNKIARYGAQPTTTLIYPLNEIMKILEGKKLSVESIKEMVENSMDSDELIKSPDSKFREEREISHKQIEEAIYYLDIYNAHLHCLQFLCRQQMWSKALDYVFKKNVSREVFIDGLIAPAVSRGQFSSVKTEILMKEGGLSSWKSYYEPICKFLDKKCLYDDLLEFQEKTGDHFQATKTLTNHFYLRGSQSYSMLRDKLGFLEKAQSHLERFINKKENNPKFDLQKLMKNLVLLKQQISATIILTDPITINRHQAKIGYIVQSSSPPTLFGSPDALVDLCLMILFCRPNVSDGLQMLCPLMAQCHIYPEYILPKAAIWLLQHPQCVQTVMAENDTTGVTAVLDLCTNICSCYRLDTRKNDEILLAILPVIPLSLLIKSNLVNRFIGLFQAETKKIDAFIIVKDFRRAFTNAVRQGYVNEVQRILELAEAANDLSGVVDLCKQWLTQNRGNTSSIVGKSKS